MLERNMLKCGDYIHCENKTDIAGRLPENSRNSFVDLQSQKTAKQTAKKFVISLKADVLHFG